ncbi:PstA family ABC transporter permease [Humisphaera borealis]|uniref:ABC transporter permease subunit n=1 Tax=Humisphaera borealis TaxID=2807512 RepID=A0A7M2WV29_9BACT|nr:ABC transporter permease subunit [Humisphaera borealis]QOV89174.1 ABC transporter permease subunit [Humisphaera borealis]
MRRWSNLIVGGAATACGLIACTVLLWIVFAILFRGLPAVRWQFLTEQIRLVGAEGGIFYNLVGTGILMATAAVITTPLSVAIALAQGFYLRGNAAQRAVTLLLYLLNGVPSILFGILGLIVFVKYFDWGKSWLTGGILLGLMITPTVSVALLERIRMIPERYIEAAAGLGLTRSQIVRSVILPQSIGGLVTGLLLGLARAVGETAPIMFTATIFAGATFPTGIIESPVLALPYHIFQLAQDSFNPDVAVKVWGTATVLLGLVFLLSLVSLPIRLKVHEEARHA